jgi:glycine/D-amino acid oxidase-like deaminating enzyme
MTAGPGMGKAIAEVIAGAKPGIDLAPFDPGRFP